MRSRHPGRRTRVAVWALPTLTAALLLGGCSGDGSGDEELGPKPDLPTEATEPLWNPCSALELAPVEKALGTTFSRQAGTPTQPACRFTPTADGGPAVDVNYQLYSGTLDELFSSFGTLASDADTDLSTPKVPGSDDARLVLDVQDDTLAVTGFVQNGELVQLVNVLDPAPFDRARIASGVETMLADLAARADRSGLSGE